MPFQSDAFQGDAFQLVPGPISGTLIAEFVPDFTATMTIAVTVAASVSAEFIPSFTASATGNVTVRGTVVAEFVPSLVASFTGTSEGTIIIVPRDVGGGIEHLVEMGAFDTQEEVEVTHRFATKGFNSLPTDNPPNAPYRDGVKVAGNFSRTFFADGTTAGSIEVGYGEIGIVNLDGSLDYLLEHAIDGRELVVKSIARINPLYAEAVTVFRGTMEQIEVTWGLVTVRMRDRLADLEKPLQTVLFAGTTTAGGMDEAEGTADGLKDQPKPLAYGAVPMVAAVVSNQYDHIFDLGADGLSAVSKVWDKGVELTATGTNYTTIAGLRSASIPPSKYATCLTKGLIRTGSSPVGQITAAPVEGTSGQRTAAQIAKRMLIRMGKVQGVDFLASDIAALDAANPAEIGFWTGTDEIDSLEAVTLVLGSIGAALVPDRLGVLRMYRLQQPTVSAGLTIRRPEMLERGVQGVERLSTGDQGKGVPAWKVTLNYAHNWGILSRGEMDLVNATDPFKAFAEKQWRTAVATDETVKTAHKLASELTFDTYFVNEADAQAEVSRRLSLYKVRRDRLRVPVKSYVVEAVDVGMTVGLQMDRFGLDAGKTFVVIGMDVDLQTKITTLDLWG